MKSLFLAGGCAGFVLCSLAGLAAGRASDLILRDAAIGCLAGALLVRWFWLVLLRGFRETLAIRRRAADEAAAAAQQNGHAQPNGLPAKNGLPAATASAAATAAAPSRSLPFAQPKPVTR
jgi:hypothetical protein